MQLSEREAELVLDLRRVPEEAAQQVVDLAHRLAAASERGAIDWSDEWSEADLREFTRASSDRLEDGG